MKNLSDDRLEKMLTDYMEAEPQQSFVYDPDHHSEKIIPFVRFRKQLIAAASCLMPIKRAVAIDPAIVLKGE